MEGGSSDDPKLELRGRGVHSDGHRPDYDSRAREKKENWDMNGGRDAREWNSEISDSDGPNPPHRPYFDDSDDSDAFEDFGPREHRGEGKPNKATTVTLTETEVSPITLYCRHC